MARSPTSSSARSSARSTTRASFEVADTGVGISREALAYIFEPFRQADSGAPHPGGVGLGLYLVRRLLDALGGDVSVESEVGLGTVFRVSIPTHPHAPARRTVSDHTAA